MKSGMVAIAGDVLISALRTGDLEMHFRIHEGCAPPLPFPLFKEAALPRTEL